MLGHPAFLPAHPTTQAQGEAFLAKQRVATVARADAPDEALFGEVHNEATVRIEVADGVQAREELATVFFKGVERNLAHACGDAQVGDDVGAVSYLNSDLGVGRA